MSPAQKSREGFAELVEKNPDGPLRFRFLRSEGKPFNQAEAETQISRAVVADIARLTASGPLLANRPLKFGDMAVLVRSNAQAANLQNLLRASGIKSVLKAEQSVFKTHEACETLRLLEAVLEPGRDILLRTALATSLVGLSAAEILALDLAEAQWQGWLEKFLVYRSMWENSCFIALFRYVFVDQKVRQRLVQYPGGERILTNFMHIAELLHRAEIDQRLTPDALCAWLRQHISDSAKTDDEEQLRLESDDDALLLASVHKSKGLQYPIVFCPFLWKASDTKNRREVLFHDPTTDYRLTLDLRDERPAPDDNNRMAGEECVAESLRVLYVALTRAQNRCYVYAGDIFDFDVKHGGPGLSAEFSESLGRLHFQPVEGFMRGFIDLLFRFGERYYIVDWKSNWLGNRPSNYDEKGIRACMVQHSYFLQYHLYTVAADMYLSRRIAGYEYDKQFGGVFYVFFRGLDPEKPDGAIFRDRPRAALIHALRQLLIGGLS